MRRNLMPQLQRPERLAIALLIVVALLTLVQGCARTAQPAPGMRLVASLDLSQGPFDELVLARLRVNDTIVLRLHLRFSQLDTPSLKNLTRGQTTSPSSRTRAIALGRLLTPSFCRML